MHIPQSYWKPESRKHKKVIKHLKGDIETFKHEAHEDRELIHALKKPTHHSSKEEYSPKHHHALSKHHAKLADHHTKMAKHHSHKAKESPKAKSFIEKRMHEFKEGKMHSRKSKTGPLVTNPKQAIAIALSESRKKGLKVSRKK